ncbi:2-oxoglutarate dehydrogenase, E1 subunit [Gemmatirosa kalamazoonensis]|uniref:oxoglutarate dehydrogenase (succinyl-transferring) n=1 Tax=Gemmatirosa kalamazoonensis TaxID=861299 RepID=W0RDZ3_9BACT|nr:2-oxoglutarate dehydrogenase E1 component [Gemmatirosa kalamazoonensis]AHG87603.1 2-oxoglutarate dehydrogenase, E1 subunit [Gemmatirosa kalamazoonensis]
MTSPAITSVFNDAYIAEMYESYRRDPGSVDESWRQYFRAAESLAGLVSGAPAGPGAGDPEIARKAAGAAGLVEGLREYGHLAVQLDPLGSPPIGASELTPEFYGITEAELDDVPAAALGFDERFRTAGDVVRLLRKRYSATLGLEYSHVASDEERDWFRQVLREEQLTRPLTPEEKRAALVRLTEVDGLERYLGFRYQGKKRFSIEGTDALVPMLDAAIAETAADGARSVVIGMAHRGRLNVLTHVMGKPYEVLFGEFEGRHPNADSDSETGDVKYHMGYRNRRDVNGVAVDVELVPNPSHLEFTGCVADGVARAKQRVPNAPGTRDEALVLPIVIHGDAAFMGEGVVAETLNMSKLRGYQVGGTLHIITNNQVGFTTDPTDSRSTYYASDLAKGFDIPVIHVNGDDAEACIAAVRIAVGYRARFRKDFLIDLVGYRRWGHNETDEPAFTQPVLYDRIKAHPTPRQVWGERLVKEGVLSAADVEGIDKEARARFDAAYERVRQTPESMAAAEGHDSPEGPPAPPPDVVETAVPAERLTALNDAMLRWPDGFTPHPRLAKILARRAETLGDKGGIEWGQAEALAFASLLVEGTSVRLDGQDAERGTFGHRNAVIHDVKTGATHTPLASLPGAKGAFEVWNSPLTETAVMGFDYGYSVAAPDTLALWEAQYGDFVNVAQVIIDQYLVADRAKWSTDSGLVLLLPHGYEGGGPEHSSARLERFLQSCAEGNIEVAYPSTPAQYFHILRRQAKRSTRRPLVLMQPKSLLRLPAAASRLAELAEGGFQPVIPDPRGLAADAVRRVVLCTAKMYYDLTAGSVPNDVAVVRVEELYPWPAEELTTLLGGYPNAREVVWAQEEPQNMGAWPFAAPRLRALAGDRAVTYVGRPERASPAEGYESAHKAEQARIVAEALAVSEPARQTATV